MWSQIQNPSQPASSVSTASRASSRTSAYPPKIGTFRPYRTASDPALETAIGQGTDARRAAAREAAAARRVPGGTRVIAVALRDRHNPASVAAEPVSPLVDPSEHAQGVGRAEHAHGSVVRSTHKG